MDKATRWLVGVLEVRGGKKSVERREEAAQRKEQKNAKLREELAEAQNHEYAGELKAARDSNAKLREQLERALIGLEKIASYQGRFGEDDPQSVASDILSNAAIRASV